MNAKRRKSHKLALNKPTNIFQKSVEADWKKLFTAVGRGLVSIGIGKYDEACKNTLDAICSFGITTGTDEAAALLIRRSIVRSLFDLIEEAGTELSGDTLNLSEQIDYSIAKTTIEIDSSFFKNPRTLPFLKDLQLLIKSWLALGKINEASIEAIINRLPSYFVYNLISEWRTNSAKYEPIAGALNSPFAEAGEREWNWELYNALLQKRIEESVFDEPFSLAQLYVPLNASYAEDTARNPKVAEPLGTDKQQRKVVIPLMEEILNWVKGTAKDPAIKIISGGPGSGKSSFAKILAVEASRIEKSRTLFIPLHLIDATRSVVEEVGRFVKEEGILRHNPLDPEAEQSNLFIIFDGLDELASQGKAAAETARDFIREVEKFTNNRNLHSAKIKVLISGRELIVQESESELRGLKQILCILPYFLPNSRREGELVYFDHEILHDPHKLLEKDLREKWWVNYGKLTGHGYKKLPKELNRDDLAEITAQPLLNYLVALSLSRGKLDFTKDVNINTVYYDLVGAVYERGYEHKRPYGPIRHLKLDQFTRILEEVGIAAWHGDGRTTTVEEIDNHCRSSGLGGLLDAFTEGAKAGVTRLLAAFFFRRQGERVGTPTFVFTHKSFGEYLTARRIVRSILKITREQVERHEDPDQGWDEREALKHWATICGRSPISKYLLKFIRNEIAIIEIEKLQQAQRVFASLFSFMLKHGMPMELVPTKDFKEAYFNSKNSEEGLLVALNACATVTKQISVITHPTITSFGTWFRKIQGQRAGSESCVAALCLSYLDLTGITLDIADLYGANFRCSRLDNVVAHLACFEMCNLQGTSMKNATLWRCNFRSTSLSDIDLSGSTLTENNFTGSNTLEVKAVNIQGRLNIIGPHDRSHPMHDISLPRRVTNPGHLRARINELKVEEQQDIQALK